MKLKDATEEDLIALTIFEKVLQEVDGFEEVGVPREKKGELQQCCEDFWELINDKYNLQKEQKTIGAWLWMSLGFIGAMYYMLELLVPCDAEREAQK